LATVYLSEEPGEIKTILSTQKEKLSMFLFYNYCWDDYVEGDGLMTPTNYIGSPKKAICFRTEQRRII